MIRDFADHDTQRLFLREEVRRFHAFERSAFRKLRLLHAIRSLSDLKSSGLSLETLKGNRKGQHSIRINDRWRICFVWNDGDAYRVEIVDYH